MTTTILVGSIYYGQSILEADNKDKNYIEFLYRTVMGDRLRNNEERLKYKDAIMRTRKEVEGGKFHYPAIVNYVNGIRAV